MLKHNAITIPVDLANPFGLYLRPMVALSVPTLISTSSGRADHSFRVFYQLIAGGGPLRGKSACIDYDNTLTLLSDTLLLGGQA